MTNWLRQWGLGILVGSGTLCSGCADQQESLVILRAPAWPEDGSCLIDPSASASLLQGTYDVAYDSAYLLPVEVENRLLPQQPNQTNSGTDNSELQLVDADVSLRSESELIGKLADRNGDYVDFSVGVPGDSLSAGATVGLGIEVFSAAAAVELRAALVELNRDAGIDPLTPDIVTAEVVVNAARSGNSRGGAGGIASRSYAFPISVCLGCVCQGCAAAQCPAPGPDGSIAADLSGYTGGVCGNTQDLPLVPPACLDE